MIKIFNNIFKPKYKIAIVEYKNKWIVKNFNIQHLTNGLFEFDID